MRMLLGAEADELFAALGRPAPAGLRLNPLRGDPARLVEQLPWPLAPVPWCPTGYVVQIVLDDAPPADTPNSALTGSATPGSATPGRHPYHDAGVYYLQDPAAMAVAEALAPRPGERVLDLAAAPGGKSTHLAGMLGGRGLLVANDVHPRRAQTLLGNLERLGVRNAVVTNEAPERLARAWPGAFDRVLLDAPCSGEGMFRKSPDAIAHWSEANVLGCARRQDELLAVAADLVRPGGTLAYATCTFAPEENEGTVTRFLARRTDYELVPIALPGVRPGQAAWVDPPDPRLRHAVRIWPHTGTGEGHFVALFRRAPDSVAGTAQGADQRTPRSTVRTRSWADAAAPHGAPRLELEAARRAWASFARTAFVPDWHVAFEPDALFGVRLLSYPDGLPPLAGVHVLRAGLHLADLRRPGADAARGGASRARSSRAWVDAAADRRTSRQGRQRHDRPRHDGQRHDGQRHDGAEARLEPAHALAMAVPAQVLVRRVALTPDDPRVAAYLAGGWFALTHAEHAALAASEAAHARSATVDADTGSPPPGATRYVRVDVDEFPLGWGRLDVEASRGDLPDGPTPTPDEGATRAAVRSLLPKGLRRGTG